MPYCTRESCSLLEAALQKVSENYPRVAPIRSVDNVTIISGLCKPQVTVQQASRVEPREYVPCITYHVVYGIFYVHVDAGKYTIYSVLVLTAYRRKSELVHYANIVLAFKFAGVSRREFYMKM